MTTWLDHVAADLLHTEQELRTTLRNMSRGKPPTTRRAAAGWLEIRTSEARTLLRGVMPTAFASSRMREPHARLVVALDVLQGHLIALNDPYQAAHPEAAIGAACQLLRELGRWVYTLRWTSACRAARVRIPLPITPVMQSQTPSGREHLPNAWAGRMDQVARGGGPPTPLPHQLRQLRAEQAELDLASPASAEVIDLRQLHLQLTPPTKETRHATASA